MTDPKTPEDQDATPMHQSLAEALAAFQAELPKLTKDEKAKVKGETKDGRAYDRSYGYADLAQVVETVLPVLGRHGLSVTAKNIFTSDGYILRVTLLHESGGSDAGDWPLPDPRRSGPQDIGSAMTYGRRYLTLALSGAYPGGEDDDGAKAQGAPRDRWEDAQPRPASQQATDQHRRGVNHTDDPAPVSAPPAKTSWTDDEVAEYQAKLTQVDLAHVGAAYDWMASRDLHGRGVGASGKTATLVLALRLADTALTPESTAEDIAALKAIAEDRGLLKVKVSASETLEQALYEARELAVQAATQNSPGTVRSSLVGE